MKEIDLNIDISDIEESTIDLKYEDDFRTIELNCYTKSLVTNLNSELNNNILLICPKKEYI